VVLLTLALLLSASAGKPGASPVTPAARPTALPPFLNLFKGAAERPPLVREVQFPSAVGAVRGLLARPDNAERLPALLLLHDEHGLDAWMKITATELASIGYVVLALDLHQDLIHPPGDERTLARSSAAVRCLRRRTDVQPHQIGVVGWSWGAGQALALAGSTLVQACVLCEGVPAADPGVLAGLRGTALLSLMGSKDERARQAYPAFARALTSAHIAHKVLTYEGAQKEFMRPTSPAYAEHAAEEAWVALYEFLGKHVEDAPEDGVPPAAPAPGPGKVIATIADLMRAVNEPTGVRGTLLRLLEREPNDDGQWAQARACAALLSEAGALLRARTPPRGSHQHWLQQVAAYQQAAAAVVTATDQRDYAGAQRALQTLATRCASCHREHR
jgi:dienelactone hydrolase